MLIRLVVILCAYLKFEDGDPDRDRLRPHFSVQKCYTVLKYPYFQLEIKHDRIDDAPPSTRITVAGSDQINGPVDRNLRFTVRKMDFSKEVSCVRSERRPLSEADFVHFIHHSFHCLNAKEKTLSRN